MSRTSAGLVPAGGPSSPAFSFFAHFSPLSGHQKQAAHQILPHLFLGSAAAARSATWLQQNRITHIVCVHNAEVSPHELKRQLTISHPAGDTRATSHHHRQQTVAGQLVVHPDRCVYCCCYVQDTPQQVFLPVLFPVMDFIDNAIRDQSFRGGGSQASGSQTPRQSSSAPQRKYPRRNHMFVSAEEQTSLVDESGEDGRESRSSPKGEDLGSSTRNSLPQGSPSGAPHGNVLVHCAKGISRSASLVICYLMFRRCWSYADSFTYIRRKRPIYPNVGFQIQLQEIQKRLQRFRPTIPRVDEAEEGLKRVTPTAVAAGLVRPDDDEPDLFRRDPTAAEKLLEIFKEARTALDSAALEQRLVASILTQLLETQELVENMFSQSSLLRDRQKWELHGLFFENLKSYGVAAPAEVLATAEKVAKRASDLKLVFTATLPGVAMADTVAEEIRRWVQVATKVAEEREKKAQAERPKKEKIPDERSAGKLIKNSGGDAQAETLALSHKKPHDDLKGGGAAANGCLSPRSILNSESTQEKHSQSGQKDGSDGLDLSSGHHLFGTQVSSTAATLRERLKKIREKRAALADTSKGPGTDQASSAGTCRDARNSEGPSDSPAKADESRSGSPRMAVPRHPPDDDWKDRRQMKKLKKQKKREKKEKKRMKKQKNGRSGRSLRAPSSNSFSSGSVSSRSSASPRREHSSYRNLSPSDFARKAGNSTSDRTYDREERERREISHSSSRERRPHSRFHERGRSVESRGRSARTRRRSSYSEESRRGRRDSSRSPSCARWRKRRRSSSRSLSPRRRREGRGEDKSEQEAGGSRCMSQAGSLVRSETKRVADRKYPRESPPARRRVTRSRSVESRRSSSRSRSLSPALRRLSRERAWSPLSHSRSRSPREEGQRRR
ncbi:dual specificity phosphatase, catalytic domain-containing protein [Toxoplasma gondii GT1]|uniref:protein-tyrosine-phosphatase n=2 Tax=Toxoplasma gondii TaxID=5811 RepID=S7WDF7_TOXGG|nr:dual specificity phosphatase, catalytic domain-containing protein [Toxoplasma gondii GT1]KAF4642434.1 dual specificity phosphatase, catalytic domain-containing protein [Toxoplasma gondii]